MRVLEIRINLESEALTLAGDVTDFLLKNASRIEAAAATMGTMGALIDANGNVEGGVYSIDNVAEFVF